MELVNDLGSDVASDVALAILVEKRYLEKIDSKEILPLILKIRQILEPISSKDHTHYLEPFEGVNVMGISS